MELQTELADIGNGTDDEIQANLTGLFALVSHSLWTRVSIAIGDTRPPKTCHKPGDMPTEVDAPNFNHRSPSSAWRKLGRPWRWLQQRAQHLGVVLRGCEPGSASWQYYLVAAEDVAGELRYPPLELTEHQEHFRRQLLDAADAPREGAEAARAHYQAVCGITDALGELKGQATNKDEAESDAKWLSWIQDNLAGGARRIHRWTRPLDPAGFKDHVEANQVPKLPHQVLDGEVARLSGLWKSSSVPSQHPTVRQEHGGMLDTGALTAVSKSFGAFAAYSPDGWHLRHYQHTYGRFRTAVHSPLLGHLRSHLFVSAADSDSGGLPPG